MYSKVEVVIIGAVALIAGFGIGYSKAREMFCEALVKATANSLEKMTKEEPED